MTAPDGGPKNPRPDALLTQLGVEVHELQARYRDLQTMATGTAEVTTSLANELAEQGQAIKELSDAIDAITITDPKVPPVRWPLLDSEQAANEWGRLAYWIAEELVPWYGLTRGQLPDCWPRHRRAVIELSWLRCSYDHAHLLRSHTSEAAEWHTRWLDAALRNIAAAIPEKMCRPGEHLVDQHTSTDQRRSAGARATPPTSTDRMPWERAAEQPEPTPEPAPMGVVETERGQLAEKEHWWPSFLIAQREDLQWRLDREHAPAEPTN